MAAGDEMQGRRVELDDVSVPDLEVGDYAVGDGFVWLRLPTGSLARLNVAPAQREGPVWGMVEHDDGTITLDPSILQHEVPGHAPRWHGYLVAGVWKAVE